MCKANLTPANGAMTRFLGEMEQRSDAFRAIMIAFVVATLLVPLLRNVAPTPAPAQSH